MQAIRIHSFGDPSVLQLNTLPDPKPAAGQVLIQVRAVGVNPVDTYIRKGIYGPREFPFTPGSDCSGVVLALGPNTDDGAQRHRRGTFPPLKVGDRVYTYGTLTGAYAELALALDHRTYPLPDHLSFEQGAAIGVPYSTAYHALFDRGQARPGDTLLVHGGSGGVGTAAIQLARNAGLTIVATAGTDKGLQLVRDQGAHHALNHTTPNYLDDLMKLTHGRGVDLIAEMLANVNLGKDLPVLAKFGRVLVVGNRGTVEINPRDTMSREADIRGVTLANATEDQLLRMHTLFQTGFAQRTLTPIVGRSFPLSDAPKAHEAILAPGSHGKIVLIP